MFYRTLLYPLRVWLGFAIHPSIYQISSSLFLALLLAQVLALETPGLVDLLQLVVLLGGGLGLGLGLGCLLDGLGLGLGLLALLPGLVGGGVAGVLIGGAGRHPLEEGVFGVGLADLALLGADGVPAEAGLLLLVALGVDVVDDGVADLLGGEVGGAVVDLAQVDRVVAVLAALGR